MAFQQQGKDHLLSIDSISLLMSEIQYLSNSTLTTSRTQHLFNFYENNSSLLSYAHAMAPSHRIHFHRHPIPHATLLTSNSRDSRVPFALLARESSLKTPIFCRPDETFKVCPVPRGLPDSLPPSIDQITHHAHDAWNSPSLPLTTCPPFGRQYRGENPPAMVTPSPGTQ